MKIYESQEDTITESLSLHPYCKSIPIYDGFELSPNGQFEEIVGYAQNPACIIYNRKYNSRVKAGPIRCAIAPIVSFNLQAFSEPQVLIVGIDYPIFERVSVKSILVAKGKYVQHVGNLDSLKKPAKMDPQEIFYSIMKFVAPERYYIEF